MTYVYIFCNTAYSCCEW